MSRFPFAMLGALGVAFAGRPLLGQTVRVEPVAPRPILGFGAAVAVSGDQILVGRPGSVAGFPMPAAQQGGVHVFARAPEGWTETGMFSSHDGTVGDGFGSALATRGNWVLVGAPAAGDHRGAAYLFERTGTTWTERAKLALPDGAPGDAFGATVALDEGVAFVAATARAKTGAVYLFRRAADGSWSLADSLRAGGLTEGGRFGTTLALEGTTLLIGAPGGAPGGFLGGGPPPVQGRVFAYQRDASGGWSLTGTIAAGDSAAGGFGTAALVRGATVFVGAPGADQGRGAVLSFRRESNEWNERGRLVPQAPSRGAAFGGTVAAAGTDLLVGAPGEGNGAGAVHVFQQQGDGWVETQVLTAPNVGLGTLLGSAIAGSTTLAVIGGPYADFFEGKGFVFTRGTDGHWIEQSTIADHTPGFKALTGEERRCTAETIEGFSCADVDLVSFLPTSDLGAKRGIMVNDLWGWTDPASQREFVILGRFDGTSFVEVTDPAHPVYLGDLPLHAGAVPNLWRDIKTYRNHAFIVADGAGPHGMQVFDLAQLLTVRGAPVTFSETAHYDKIASAHNIVINEESGFAYAVGGSMGGETCGGALHMIDIRNPREPRFAGCYADPATGRARTGYTHDAQCVTYRGPDSRYKGREICFNASETALGIADVTEKNQPKALSSASYPNVAYSHQGWLSEDQKYFFLDDELDELSGTVAKTRTLVWDVTDLQDPVLLTEFLGATEASDHNLYVKDHYMYQSNYVAGLRVVDVRDPAHPVEVGHFDTVPYGENTPGFAGSWSNYPYFKSGVIAVSSMREGLFLVRYRPRTPIP